LTVPVRDKRARLLLDELSPLLKLAIPVVLAELGWMLMGVVDTIMVGRIGPAAIGAVGVGNVLFQSIGLLSIGLLLGLDTLIAQAFGAGDIEDCNHSLRQGLWIAAAIGPMLWIAMLLALPLLGRMNIHPEVERLAIPYAATLAWSVLPLAFYAAFRRYLQAVNAVRPVMFALLSANLVNVAANWALIFGNLGFPALGVTGAAWATFASRCYMALFLLAVLVWRERAGPTRLFRWEPPDIPRIRKLLRLGAPAAGHIFLEIAVFAAATALAAQFPPVAFAAHQIVLTIASVTYMAPLGVSSAAAVRVGQALGRRDLGGVRAAGWTALSVGVSFMGIAGLAMLLFPGAILRLFTLDRAVIDFGAPLLVWAAAFQLFDGTQVVSTGALRGLGDTRTAFWANMFGYWILGLPVGAGLCFRASLGIPGLWIGLTIGLVAAAAILLHRWRRATHPAPSIAL
jgi:MATE family multidrug resistance protein